METKNEYRVPFIATHPGTVLKLELDERNIKQKDFAKTIGMLPSHLNEIIKGKRGISLPIANKLEKALHISTMSWMNLQNNYDYDIEAIKELEIKEIEAQNELNAYNNSFDVHTVLKRLGISGDKSVSSILEELKAMLCLPIPAELQLSSGKFKKSLNTGLDKRMILTWVLLAKWKSRSFTPKGKFDRDRCGALIEKLKGIFNKNENVIENTQDAMSEYGIKFNTLPKVDKASIDGFSFMDDGVPSIILTMRYNMIDHFAFDTLHELYHVMYHIDDCNNEMISIEGNDDNIEEKEANSFAANSLISESLWKTAPMVSMNPFIIQRGYFKWAEKIGVNKWIVLGRISKETGMYKFKTDNSRKIN